MKFHHSEIEIDEGDAICVSLDGNEGTVMVMDDLNFCRYRNGSPFEFAGGRHGQSPAIIRPPKGGHWNVVVEGYSGEVEAAVTVLR